MAFEPQAVPSFDKSSDLSAKSAEASINHLSGVQANQDQRRLLTEPGLAKSELPSVSTYTNRLVVALFALTNLVIFELSLSLASYQANADRLRMIFGPVYALLALIVVFFSCRSLLASALRAIKLGELNSSVNLALALLVSCGFTLHSVIFDPILLATISLASTTVAIALALLLKEPLDIWIATGLANSSNFAVSTLCKRLRLVGDESKVDLKLGGKENTLLPDSHVWISVQSARCNDRFRVLQGEIIPCDGVITAGNAEIFERRLSGVETLRIKGVGDEIYAGSRLVQGEIDCRVTTLFEDSVATSMERVLNDALVPSTEDRSRFVRFDWICNATLLCTAFLMAEFVFLAGRSTPEAILVAVSILLLSVIPEIVARFPALRRAVIVKAFKVGILVKKLAFLDKLQKIRTVIFDYAAPKCAVALETRGEIQSIEVLDERFERAGVLSAIVSLCSQIDAQLAKEITTFARKEAAQKFSLIPATQVHYYPGLGVSAVLGSADFSIGTEEFLIERGVQLESGEVISNSEEAIFIYVAFGDELVGRIKATPDTRFVAPACIKNLQGRGLRALLLGREDAKVLDPEGKRIGLDLADIHAGLAEEELAIKVRSLNPALMIASDLSADAVIKAADLSMAQFDEYRWEIERGDMIVFDRGISAVCDLFNLATKARWAELAALSIVGATTAGLLLLVLFAGLAPVWVLLTEMAASVLAYLCMRAVA